MAVWVAASVAAGVVVSVAVRVAACAAAGVPVVVWVAACVAAGVEACVAEMAHGAFSPTISCDGSGMDTAFGATGDSMDAADVWDQSEESADEV